MQKTNVRILRSYPNISQNNLTMKIFASSGKKSVILYWQLKSFFWLGGKRKYITKADFASLSQLFIPASLRSLQFKPRIHTTFTSTKKMKVERVNGIQANST